MGFVLGTLDKKIARGGGRGGVRTHFLRGGGGSGGWGGGDGREACMTMSTLRCAAGFFVCVLLWSEGHSAK